MEIGQSKWKFSNYKILKNANNELKNNGQVLFYNYDNFIMDDSDVKILKYKRKLHGKLYYYVLEKL
jgi:hypothetical protein